MDKQHILEEIKRTAAVNGGRALGKERFFGETGIKQTDWYGKYWIRWNDAVREAGFEPNSIRELGHFPVDAEVRMKSRADPSFPSRTTFDSHLGSKHQRVAKIQQYCEGRTGYDDVAALCGAIANSEPVVSDSDVGPEEAFGFVYLIKSGRYYKIGRTNAVGRREYELAIQLPEKANAVHSIRTDDPIGEEKRRMV